jgi:hypothetical protein
VPDIIPLSTAPVQHLSLSSPARQLARPSLSVEPEDSLALGCTRLIQNGDTILPVIAGDRVVGVLTGEGLAAALGDAVEPSDAVSNYLSMHTTIRGYATGAEALRAFVNGQTLVVVDDDQRLIGLLSPADLFPKHRPQIRPAMVGGMATPLGVYLTSGNTSSGVSKHALVTAGACMTALAIAALMLGQVAGTWFHKHGLTSDITADIQAVASLLAFALIFRLAPLSGIHGAEHQVVHAIERELELTPSVVKRMPLVHPRCGTNYSVAFSLFLAVFSWEWIGSPELRLLLAIVVTLSFWRPLGRLAQKFITTKKPSQKQLEQAIDAGHELLAKYATARTTYPTVFQRVWNTGLPFLLLGGLAMGLVATGISWLWGQGVF